MSNTAENNIDIRSFVEETLTFLRTLIFVSKGTINEELLEKSISVYNRLAKITNGEKSDIGDRKKNFKLFLDHVRRIIKRVNLVLKVNPDGTAVDITDKNSQKILETLECHPSLVENNKDAMIEHATVSELCIFQNIPLSFCLEEGEYQEIMWQTVRVIYFMSQILLCKNNSTIVAQTYEYLENALTNLIVLQQESDILNKVKNDEFLKIRLFNDNHDNINKSVKYITKSFRDKGINEGGVMYKTLQKVAEKLEDGNIMESFQNGDIVSSVFGLANGISQEMGEQDVDPENGKKDFGSILQILRTFVEESDTLPAECKEIIELAESQIGGSEPDEETMNKIMNMADKQGIPNVFNLTK
jgi:hypothetical protein